MSPSVESPCHGVRDHPFTWGFLVFEKVVFSKGTCRTLLKQDGKKGGQDRVERGQEMGENVEIVLGMRDGIQVHSSFHTDVKELEYKDLLTWTFTRRISTSFSLCDAVPSSTGRFVEVTVDEATCHACDTVTHLPS